VSPLLLLFILGLTVGGIMITNQVQLTNAVRDGARAASVCGGPERNTLLTEANSQPVPTLPNGQSCDSTHLIAFIQGRLQAVPSATALSVCVYTAATTCTSTASNVLDECAAGKVVEVQASFQQPLYLPLVGHFFGDGGSNYRTISASADAVCEQ